MPNICYHCFHYKNDEVICPYCGHNEAEDSEKYPFAMPAGSTLADRYVIGHVLGQGGFGITYIALERNTKSRVAIKEFFPVELATRVSGQKTVQVFSGDMQEAFIYGKEQFLNEATTLTQFIGNENIVKIQHCFEENGTAYFAMEYVVGQTLGQLVERSGGRIPVDAANRILIPIMEALEWVHSKGTIHRDLSPENIIIRPDGTSKLLDFGAARYSTGDKSKSLDVVLKHGFAPMEQYTRRGKQGPYTDVYAMAATYYYAVTGQILQDAVDRSDNDEMKLPSELGTRIRESTEEVLKKALSVQAKDRYQTMKEFYSALVETMPEPFSPSAAGPKRRPKKQKTETENKRFSRAFAVLLSFALLAGGTFLMAKTETGHMLLRDMSIVFNDPVSPQEETPEEQNAAAENVDAETMSDTEKPAEISEDGEKYEASNNMDTQLPGAESEEAQEKDSESEEGKVSNENEENTTDNNTESDLPGASLEESETESVQDESEDSSEEKAADNKTQLELSGASQEEASDAEAALDESKENSKGNTAEEDTTSEQDYTDGNDMMIPEESQENSVTVQEDIVQPVSVVRGDIDTPGSIITFGRFESSGENKDEKPAIQWIVLDAQDSRRLLISRDVLAFRPFNSSGDEYNVSWENCSLRVWLNNTFLNTAFTDDEREAILTTEVDNSPPQGYSKYVTKLWNNTEDRVFIMSYAEAWKFFATDIDRICTTAERRETIWDEDGQMWWLRSPGFTNREISYVFEDGTIQSVYANAGSSYERRITNEEYASDFSRYEKAAGPYVDRGVRPVMWVDINKLEMDLEPLHTPKIPDYGDVGTIVQFGKYEQDNDTDNGDEPIEWIVLDQKGDKRLLLSLHGIDQQKYNQQAVSTCWEDCSLRYWLNNDFLNSAFTEEDKQALLHTVVSNRLSAGGGSKSYDAVYLPSYSEMLHYLPNAEDRVCEPSDYVAALAGNSANNWLLRSQGMAATLADYMSADGQRRDEPVHKDELLVRPMLWVDFTILMNGPDAKPFPDVEAFRKPGNVVKFGRYEQNNNSEDGDEEIEWTVQQISGNKVNLISRCTLDQMKYHPFQRAPLTWENCDVRRWLNNDFLEMAFNASEQNAIMTTNLDNEGYHGQEPSTQDKIYIPLYAENGYNGSCPASEYVRAKDKDASYFWALRRTMSTSFGIANVTNRGAVIGRVVSRSSLMPQSIRPEIWVDLSSDYFTQIGD